MAQERFFQLLFPEPHPYHGVVIGSHEDLENATLDDVKSFFKTYYVPNNATLVIVGDFEPSAVKALVEKYYGPIPKAAPPPGLVIKTETIQAERREAMTDEVELPMVSFGWLTSRPFEAGDAELTLGASILGNGKASRLYTELVRDQQIADQVNAYQYPLTQGSVFGVDVKGKPGVSVETLEKAVWDVDRFDAHDARPTARRGRGRAPEMAGADAPRARAPRRLRRKGRRRQLLQPDGRRPRLPSEGLRAHGRGDARRDPEERSRIRSARTIASS